MKIPKITAIIALMLAGTLSQQIKAQDMGIPTITLSNGVKMLQLGAGTFLVTGDAAVEQILFALQKGFRLIDSAQGYGNETQVGGAIRRSGLPREELFITTKIAPDAMRNGTVRQSIEESLSKLGAGYIDLMLIHWPVAGHIEETWKIMEEYVDNGKIRSIGVSNFNPRHIDDLLTYARIKPVVNQIEIHPYMTQYDVSGYNFQNGIQTESWGPLGQGTTDELTNPVIGEIAKKYGKSIAQVILRWHMQRGLITMPRCDNPDYVVENMNIFDFELTSAEMEIISGLNRNERTNAKNNPDNFPW